MAGTTFTNNLVNGTTKAKTPYTAPTVTGNNTYPGNNLINGGGFAPTYASNPTIQPVDPSNWVTNDASTGGGSNYGNYTPAPAPTVYYDSSGNSYGSQAQADQANQAIGMINFNLGRLPGQLQTAQNQIHNSYDTNSNQLQSGYDQANHDYTNSTNQNSQQFVANKNQINNQASQGIRSLLSVLGAHGAGGSSAALFAAPNAVGQVASQQRSGAGQTFGQNQQSLDTNWGNYKTGFDNSKKQLSDWLGQQLNSAQSQSDATHQGLLQQLAGLQTSVSRAQPYLDQIKSLSTQEDQLANFNPTYDGKAPVYTAPSVASYTVQAPGAPVLGAPGNNTGASSPSAFNFLLGLKDKQQQQPLF